MALTGPVLALDVGERRIGVAACDAGGAFVFPVETIVRSNLRADIARIVELAEERLVRTIVVGDPLTLEGKRGLAAEKIDAFVAHLEKAFSGRIDRIDERLSTAAAQRALIGADVSRAKRKTVVDQLAAVLILEVYVARARG
jgi:putative holliday junction resolvase